MRIVDLRDDPEGLTRPPVAEGPVTAVREILEDVRTRGDAALFEYTKRFDGVALENLRVPEADIGEASKSLPDGIRGAIEDASVRIRAFAERQLIEPWTAEVGGGRIGEQVSPVGRAGAYVPGGRAAYPSSVLMTVIPAKVAGVKEIVLCVPPGAGGTIPSVTLAAAGICGIDEVYAIGGAQAIAALAFGTETIRPVQVIVGPGNVYVALAKREVAGHVGIDSVAGPSEIAIVADQTSSPRVMAHDLIAQAEHGPHGLGVLVTWVEHMAEQVAAEVSLVLDEIEAPAELRSALDEGFVAALVHGLDHAAEAMNALAPEHLELVFDGAEEELHRFQNAGAIFAGTYSPVSLGDYFAGTNHVLPTGGAARWASGLRASHFQKTSAVVVHTRDSLQRSRDAIRAFADVEGLPNHARAVEARFDQNSGEL
ncbi:MAG: histidinol dehydrogenase [Actinobacteria bacterium]|nr:histidinol dehydrogenase [Actinomycetota bacterium]